MSACAGAWVLALATAWPLAAAEPSPSPEPPSLDLQDLDITQLVQLRITSVGKKEQDGAAAPAAVYVLSQDDIHRSGATSIPEALRFVPGLQVARIGTHGWAITSRGFNGVYANKLLVLIDGRSVYTPLFSGVYWDVQHTLLEDIDRIEVVRGPGGTLWGANAMNGVINIITKSARETLGGLVTAGAGTLDRGFAAARYGGQIQENTWFRVYGDFYDRDDSILPDGDPAEDSSQMVRGGFRLDWEPAYVSRFTLQGDVYAGTQDQTDIVTTPTPPFIEEVARSGDVSGGNLLGRWVRTIADGNEVQVQTYFDRTSRDTGGLAEDRNTFDIEAQHRFELGEWNEVIWGAGYRVTSDDITTGYSGLRYDPASRTDQLVGAFIHDDVSLVRDRLKLGIGSKFEVNDYTGFEVQPSIRLAWTPTERHTVWGSVSRTVRTPSRSEADIGFLTQVIPGDPPTAVTFLGNDDYRSETLVAYELGYRVQATDHLAFDVATFYNDYDRLGSTKTGAPYLDDPDGSPRVILPLTFENEGTGHTYGVEIAATARPLPDWRLRAGYTFLESDLELKPGSTQASPSVLADPRNQFFVHSSFDLPANLSLDAMVRYVDSLKDGSVPSYVGLDVRLAWKPRPDLELSIVGQNLLDPQHPEFRSNSFNVRPAEIERSFYAKLSLRF